VEDKNREMINKTNNRQETEKHKCFVLQDKMIKNKRAAIGEGVLMIYRMLLVMIIAIIIIALGSFYYDYDINVRNAEAQIMSKQIVNCLSPSGVLNLDLVKGKENAVLDYCGFDKKQLGRFYVMVNVSDESGKEIGILQEGDSGKTWIQNIFKRTGTTDIQKYEPGYFSWNYVSNIVYSSNSIQPKTKGVLNVYVFVEAG